jgi:predicted dehydrogenase
MNAFLSHVFYYVEWLLGGIRAMAAKTFPLDSERSSFEETTAVAAIELRDGASVSVSASNHACGGAGHRVEVYGERGALLLENPPGVGLGVFNLWRGDGKTTTLVTMADDAAGLPDARHVAVGRLVNRFAEWIRTGVAASPSFEDGVRVQQLLDLARRSHHAGQWVDVPRSASDSDPGGQDDAGARRTEPVACRAIEA